MGEELTVRWLCSAAFVMLAFATSVTFTAEEAQRPKAIQGDDLRSLFAGHDLSD